MPQPRASTAERNSSSEPFVSKRGALFSYCRFGDIRRAGRAYDRRFSGDENCFDNRQDGYGELASGWVLSKGSNGFMYITGPNSKDERMNLGTIIIGKDAPSGATTHGEVVFALPARSSAGMFKKMIAPYTPLPPAPAGGAMPAMGGMPPYMDPAHEAGCFDYNVIRESPPWEMPMSCGGWQPG